MLTHSKLFTLWLFGLISGFTLMISGNSLNYWLAKENIDLQSIGIFASILLPYSINFLWAPVFDTIKLGTLGKILGRRLAWLIIIQMILAIFVFILSFLRPQDSLLLFAVVGFIIAFFSSAQDTILGALRTEIISKELQGPASGIYIFGYRIGMLISSSGAIYLSASMGWNKIYQLFALSIIVYSIILILSIRHLRKELDHDQIVSKQSLSSPVTIHAIISFIKSVLQPVGSLSYIILIAIFLILYRLPDNFINVMINPFLLHLEYDEYEIASAGKFFGVISAIIGGVVASFIMKRKTILDSLLIFGIIHALAHTLFILQEIYGKNLLLLFMAIGFEGITGGMTMTAYIAFIASICQGKFRATQYSFFSSMMGLSRSIFPALSGYIVVKFGWHSFFVFITLATIPSLLFILKIKYKLNQFRTAFNK